MSGAPAGEALRRALRWLSETGRHDTAAIDEAALRFDLTPADAVFLLEHLRERGNETATRDERAPPGE